MLHLPRMASAERADPRYWAFLAYSPEGAGWAEWLFHSLETYGIPRILVGLPMPFGKVPKRLYPVFLDREELPLAGVQGDQIEWALRHSRSLIVVCTPEAARSEEVDRQIRCFKSVGRDDPVICLVVDPIRSQGGAASVPADALVPEAARGAFVVDARKGQDSKNAAKLRIIAKILGVGYGDLKQRDLERQHRRAQGIMAGVGALCVVFTTLLTQLYVEKRRADEAVRMLQREIEKAGMARQQALKAAEVARQAERAAIDAKRAASGIQPGEESRK